MMHFYLIRSGIENFLSYLHFKRTTHSHRNTHTHITYLMLLILYLVYERWSFVLWKIIKVSNSFFLDSRLEANIIIYISSSFSFTTIRFHFAQKQQHKSLVRRRATTCVGSTIFWSSCHLTNFLSQYSIH